MLMVRTLRLSRDIGPHPVDDLEGKGQGSKLDNLAILGARTLKLRRDVVLTGS